MDEVEDETEDEEWAECDEEYSEESEKMHVEDEEEEEEDGSDIGIEIIDSEDGQDGEGGEAGKDEGSDENMFTSKDFIAAFKEVSFEFRQYIECEFISSLMNFINFRLHKRERKYYNKYT